jgi:hypothetical protein
MDSAFIAKMESRLAGLNAEENARGRIQIAGILTCPL